MMVSFEDAQLAIDKAVKMATQSAMNNHPLSRVLWVPSTSASQDAGGMFVTIYEPPLTPSMTPSWNR